MFVPLLALAVSSAMAREPNAVTSFGVQLVYVPLAGEESRLPLPAAGLPRPSPHRVDQKWAVEINSSIRIGGHACNTDPSGCASPSIWPVGGPRVALSWRGGDSFGYSAGAIAGVGALELHQFGFWPMWEALGVVALTGEIGSGIGAAGGVEFGRSTSFRTPVGEGAHRVYGPAPLSLRLGMTRTWRPSRGFSGTWYRAGLELCPFGSDSYNIPQ